MNVSPGFWKGVVTLTGATALLLWISLAAFWMYFDQTNPNAPDIGSDRSYVLETRGHVVYLTEGERRLLSGLNYAAAILFLVAVLADVIKKPFRSQAGEL
jgi:hypothetical protein